MAIVLMIQVRNPPLDNYLQIHYLRLLLILVTAQNVRWLSFEELLEVAMETSVHHMKKLRKQSGSTRKDGLMLAGGQVLDWKKKLRDLFHPSSLRTISAFGLVMEKSFLVQSGACVEIFISLVIPWMELFNASSSSKHSVYVRCAFLSRRIKSSPFLHKRIFFFPLCPVVMCFFFNMIFRANLPFYFQLFDLREKLWIVGNCYIFILWI